MSRLILTKRCVRLLNTMTNGNTSTESIIKEKLQKNFNPIQMAVHNDSPMHHTGQSSETHFRLFIVSSVFDDIPVVKRHRMINKVLEYELEHGIHALSIDAKSAKQWNQSENNCQDGSPECKGGYGL